MPARATRGAPADGRRHRADVRGAGVRLRGPAGALFAGKEADLARRAGAGRPRPVRGRAREWRAGAVQGVLWRSDVHTPRDDSAGGLCTRAHQPERSSQGDAARSFVQAYDEGVQVPAAAWPRRTAQAGVRQRVRRECFLCAGPDGTHARPAVIAVSARAHGPQAARGFLCRRVPRRLGPGARHTHAARLVFALHERWQLRKRCAHPTPAPRALAHGLWLPARAHRAPGACGRCAGVACRRQRAAHYRLPVHARVCAEPCMPVPALYRAVGDGISGWRLFLREPERQASGRCVHGRVQEHPHRGGASDGARRGEPPLQLPRVHHI